MGQVSQGHTPAGCVPENRGLGSAGQGLRGRQRGAWRKRLVTAGAVGQAEAGSRILEPGDLRTAHPTRGEGALLRAAKEARGQAGAWEREAVSRGQSWHSSS